MNKQSQCDRFKKYREEEMNKPVRGIGEGIRQPESNWVWLVDNTLIPVSEVSRAAWHLFQGRPGCSLVIFWEATRLLSFMVHYNMSTLKVNPIFLEAKPRNLCAIKKSN